MLTVVLVLLFTTFTLISNVQSAVRRASQRVSLMVSRVVAWKDVKKAALMAPHLVASKVALMVVAMDT